MTGDELREARRAMGLTQVGLAEALGLSRKHVVAMEGGAAAIETRTGLAVQTLAAQRGKVLSDEYEVGTSPKHGTSYVSRRTVRQVPHPTAMMWTNSELWLYGEFNRQSHAQRWRRALMASENPRHTRKLIRERARETAKREAAKAA